MASDPSQLTRRQVVAAGLAAAGAAALPGAPAYAAPRHTPPLARGGSFPSGVAAGLPSRYGVPLWTRLEGLERDARVEIEVARDPDFKRVVHRERVTARADRGFTINTRVRPRRLPPGEEFYYRFEARTAASPVGRFQTFRPRDSNAPIRIGFFSCQRFEHGWFTPQAGLAQEDLDLVVSLGDYVYDEDSRPKVPERRDGSGDPRGHAETLEQWRRKHANYRSDQFLQQMHARHVFLPVWDDCEVEGNWAAGEESPSPDESRDRSIPFAQKRANAFRAFFEYMPLLRVAREPFRLYRKLTLGQNMDLFMLDTRQYRDPQPCGDSTAQPCPDDNAPGRTRLGPAQKEWLKGGLERSGAVWKILGNAQMLMSLDLPAPYSAISRDGWDGYGAERAELLQFVLDRGIKDLSVITGDVHAFFAGDATTTGRRDGRPAATEFVGASVSHDAFGVGGLSPAQSARVAEQLVLANPHLKFSDFEHRGYAVMEATRNELRVDFKGVRTVLEPRPEVFTIQSFRVGRGTPSVELV